MRAATTRDRCSKIMEAVIPYPLPSASPWGPPDAGQIHQRAQHESQEGGGDGPHQDEAVVIGADPGVDEVPQAAAADHGGQYRPADGVDGGHAQSADDGGQSQGQLYPDETLNRAHTAALGCLNILPLHRGETGVGVFENGEGGVNGQGDEHCDRLHAQDQKQKATNTTPGWC